MEWYIPITILPAVALLILSTTNQMMTLSTEIGSLLSDQCSKFEHNIAALKISQLGRLTKSATLLYISAACFVLSGILQAVVPKLFAINVSNGVLLVGVILFFIALSFLIKYAYQTIIIRKMQHDHNPALKKSLDPIE